MPAPSPVPAGYAPAKTEGDVKIEHVTPLSVASTLSDHHVKSESMESLPDFETSEPQGSSRVTKTPHNQAPNQGSKHVACSGKSMLQMKYVVASSGLGGSGGLPCPRSRQKLKNTYQFQSGVAPSQFVSRRGPLSKTSPYRGVSCYKRTGRWEAHIWHDGRQVHLGTYSTPKEAACIYDIAAIQLRGWRADLNFDISCYENDPLLREPICQPGSNLKSSDVVKLVQGLKNRRGHPCRDRPEQDMMCLQLDMPDARTAGNPEIGSFRPVKAPAPIFSMPMNGNQSNVHTGERVERPYNTPRRQGRNVDCSVEVLQKERHTPAVHGDVIYPVDDQNSRIPSSTASPRITRGRTGLFFRDDCVNVSSVMPSKVISMGGYPTNPHVVQRTCSGRGRDSQIFLSSPSAKASTVACSLDDGQEFSSRIILEGKPILQGLSVPSTDADWESVNGVIPTTLRNDGLLHVHYVGTCVYRDIQRENELHRNNVLTIPPGSSVSLSGRLQNLNSVLAARTQDGDKYCEEYSCHRNEKHQYDEMGLEACEARPNSICSRDRFPQLLQLIRDLPATKLVRPTGHQGENTPNRGRKDEKPFDGEKKLRSGLSQGSAFKTWTSNGDGQDRSQSDLCGCCQLQRKSGQSADWLSDVNNGENFIFNDAQRLSEQSGNGQKADQADSSLAGQEHGSDLSVSDAGEGSHNHVKYNEFLAAQELCRLSRMHNQSSHHGGTARHGRKRPSIAPDEAPCSLKSWKKKKIRSAAAQDIRAGSTIVESRGRGSRSVPKENQVQRRFGSCSSFPVRKVSDSAGEIQSMGCSDKDVKGDDGSLQGFRTNLQKGKQNGLRRLHI